MDKPEEKQRLSKKQKIFIEEYLQCWNATEAARRAGYSERSAGEIGCENLTKPNIATEVQRRVDEVVMSANEALSLLSDQARASLSDVGNVIDGRFSFDFAKAEKNGKLHLIKSLTPVAFGTKVELHNSQRALELIGKVYGMFIDKQELTGKDGEKLFSLPDWLKEREERIKAVEDQCADSDS